MSKIRNYSTIIENQDIDSKLQNKKPFSGIVKQTFAASCSIILSVVCGIIVGFSATALPQLKDNTTFQLTDDEESWIASMTALAMPIGGLVGYVLLDYFPRKHVMFICSLLCIIGWLFIAFATTLFMLYVGRFLTGLYIGLITPSSCIYVAEISEPRYRSLLVGLLTQAGSLGMLLVHVLGTYLDWKAVAYVSIGIQLVALTPLLFSPETPTWLVCNGRIMKAETAFRWLRSNDSEEELRALLHKYARKKQRRSPLRDLSDLVSYTFLKPFFITAIFFITQQFSGSSIVIFYTINLIMNISPNFNQYTCTIVVDVARLISSVISCYLLKIYSKKFLLLVSATGSVISIFGLAFFVQYPQGGIYNLLPVCFVVTYVAFSTIGLIPLPWIIASEIFPVRTRELGNSISTTFAFLMVFLAVKLAPISFKFFGLSQTYVALGIITLIGTVTLYFILPVTENKSLQTVEEELYDNEEF